MPPVCWYPSQQVKRVMTQTSEAQHGCTRLRIAFTVCATFLVGCQPVETKAEQPSIMAIWTGHCLEYERPGALATGWIDGRESIPPPYAVSLEVAQESRTDGRTEYRLLMKRVMDIGSPPVHLELRTSLLIFRDSNGDATLHLLDDTMQGTPPEGTFFIKHTHGQVAWFSSDSIRIRLSWAGGSTDYSECLFESAPSAGT